MMSSEPDPPPVWRADRIRRLAWTSWTIVGVLLAAAAVAAILGALAGLVIPLVVAAVMGVLLHPVVDWLERRRCPRSLGAGLVLVGLTAIVVASVWMTVVGVLDQGDEISQQVTKGIEYLDREIGARWDAFGDADGATESLGNAVPHLFGGLSSWFGSLFSGLASFVVGTGISVFFLYYVLRDWELLTSWLGGHLGVDPELGKTFVDEGNDALRSYFGAITVSSVITAIVIGLAAAALDVPLAFTIALVTFVTSYVPYIGALFSGAFAVLIALGAAGVTDAIVMLIVILVAQNLVQTMLVTKVSSDALSIHPIVNLGSTIVGGALAGLLGAMLSAPIVAILIMVQQGLARHRAVSSSGSERQPSAPEVDPEPASP
jgi:predicted PurR-regulated permease PerM